MSRRKASSYSKPPPTTHLDGRIRTPAGQRVSIIMQTADPLGMPFQHPQTLSRPPIPRAQRLVRTPRDEHGLIKLQRPDRPRMPKERPHDLAGIQVPDLDRLVVRTREPHGVSPPGIHTALLHLTAKVLDCVAFEQAGALHLLGVWSVLAMHGGGARDELVVFVPQVLAWLSAPTDKAWYTTGFDQPGRRSPTDSHHLPFLRRTSHREHRRNAARRRHRGTWLLA